MMEAPRRIDRPEPGAWMIKLVRHGPEVAARIFVAHTLHEPGDPSNVMDRSPFLAAEIAGEPVDLYRVWETKGRAITGAEYRFQLADAAWARAHSPATPKANPRAPIDHMSAPVPF